MVQLPEVCDENSVAFNNGYKTIADIAKERVRRASKKIHAEFDGQLDFENRRMLDFGFQSLKLNQSSFKQWKSLAKEVSNEDLVKQIELAVDHIDPNATQEDLLYELLLKSGITPTETITTIELAGHKVFSVGDGGLLVYLENSIDKPLIDAILEQKPEQFVCLDRAFHGNDQLKANAIKTFEAYNQALENNDPPITFRTV